MGLPSEGLPFRLIFFQGYKASPVQFFYSNENDLFHHEPSVVLTEFQDLSMEFRSDREAARLYMDGIESVSEDLLQEDNDGNLCFAPSPNRYTLYTPGVDYPLIPGFYRIDVQTGGRSYVALMQVLPGHLSQTEWEMMRDEVEAELRGLAKDLIRRNISYGVPGLSSESTDLLYRLQILRTWFPKVVTVFQDLAAKPRYRIRKQYRNVPVALARVLDEASLRHRLLRSDRVDTVVVPMPTNDYDLAENRWARSFLRLLDREINALTEALRDYDGRLEELILEQSRYLHKPGVQAHVREMERVRKQIAEDMRDVQMMRLGLCHLERLPWLTEVSEGRAFTLSLASVFDPRYQVLYQLYRQLTERERAVRLDPLYSYQWKRTDLLYELWGFLKIVKCLSSPRVGFEPVAGWLYDRQSEARHVLVPFLRPGTTVVFRRGDLRIHWVYDAVIPAREVETDPKSVPLYTASRHNRPDGRLDLFKNDVYIGSLIIDFKYRPSRTIFDPAKNGKLKDQLSSYGNHCDSPHLYGKTFLQLLRSGMRPVREVWAMYPGDTGGCSIEEWKDYRIKLIQLRPGQSVVHVEEQLDERIRDMVDMAGVYERVRGEI